MKLAVIPARGGSKRIPRKNIKLFSGKPMIAWSIEAILASKLFDKIIVSTDDDEIAEISRKYGAETPFIRPKNLSDDYTITIDVIAHAANWALLEGFSVNEICCIYPTSPFIEPSDLIKAQEKLSLKKCSYVFSATEFRSSIFRSFSVNEENGIEMFFPENYKTRTQDLPKALYDAGQFYWGTLDAWINKKILFDNHSYPQIIPSWRVHDIDTQEDWKRAELVYNSLFNIKT